MKGEQFYRGLMRIINEVFSGMEFLAVASDRSEGLTRFALSEIHQNMHRESFEISLLLLKDNRIAVVNTNGFSKDSLENLKENAVRIIESSPELPFEFKMPPLRLDFPHENVDPSMIEVKPEDRARVFDEIRSTADERDLKAFGYVSTEVSDVAIMSSNGLFLYANLSKASFNTVLLNENGTGSYTSGFGKSLDDLDFSSKVKEISDLASRNVPAVEVDPGEYTVILGPEAVSTLFFYFSYASLNGFYHELGTSSSTRYLGEKIGPDFLNFKDDPEDERQIPIPFDMVGIKRTTFPIIENGVFKNVLYSYGSHLMFGKESTGHTVSLSNLEFAIPLNPVLEGGDLSKDELFSKVDKGLYVHRFHYMNVVDLSEMILTGMTRDGLFLVESGEITQAVKNLRFNVRFYDLVKNLRALSKEVQRVEGGYTGFVAPYALFDGFTFTSKTDH